MDNQQNSNRTADGDTAQKQTKRRKTQWWCRTESCPKQAQTGCKSHCKLCYITLYPDEHARGSNKGAQNEINKHYSDSTQQPENLAILGNSSSNNANVSLQCYATSFHRSVSNPSMHTWLLSKKGLMIWKLGFYFLTGVYCIWRICCAIVLCQCFSHIASVRFKITQ